MSPLTLPGVVAIASIALFSGCGGATASSPAFDGGSRSDAPDDSSSIAPGTDGSSADASQPPADSATPPDATPAADSAAQPGDAAGPGTCASAGGTCGYYMAGFCVNGTVSSLSCGGAVDVLCCLPGDGAPPEMNPCTNAGGLCLASCTPGWAEVQSFSCGAGKDVCCMELGTAAGSGEH